MVLITLLIFYATSIFIEMVNDIGFTQTYVGSKKQEVNIILKDLGICFTTIDYSHLHTLTLLNYIVCCFVHFSYMLKHRNNTLNYTLYEKYALKLINFNQ